jgi:beta-lactamase superfamily II metal-dependent hydrolase
MATLEIFDVEHGQCSLLSSDSGAHMLVDCGHNGGTGWRPSRMLSARNIRHLDELVITNYDEDHASDLVNLRRAASIGILTRNPTVLGNDLYDLKSSGGMGAGIQALADMTCDFGSSVTRWPDYDGMTYRCFYSDYPGDFVDENNLSLVMVMRWPAAGHLPGFSILFAGDLEVAGWHRLLQRRDFIAEMRKGITVFVASHHGRRNGYCRELFDWTGLSPEIVVISDGGIQYATQETIADYRRHSQGIDFCGQQRRVFTTRRDGRITFTIRPGQTALLSTG